ncbi:MAG TPA: hypothetical protein EYN66_10405, partial [Myxococcales bacterium]|nr:hypothetical protein [Myxococcales bacterium]
MNISMPRFGVVLAVALACGCSSAQPDSQSPEQSSALDWVNPFIGSAGRGWYAGSVFVGATTPFGLVQAGPDTRPANELVPWPFDHCSGYHATDNTIRAFTHTHLHGAGIPAFGVVGFMPVSGPFSNGILDSGYASSFDKASETAEPGYYSVTLDNAALKAELTTTTRAAHHRYTPIQDGAQVVTFLVDTAHVISLAKVLDSEISNKDGVIEGWTHVSSSFSNSFGGVRTYFSAKIRNTISAAGLWGEGPERGAWNTVELAPG